MASPRRVGTENSKTRALLLDNAERLMLDEGYAAVTYRRLAAKSGVTAGLVQYYFPTLDELFLALLRRRSEQNLEKLQEALRARAGEPLRVMWEWSREETTAALMVELMALGNHRKAIRAEIAEGISRQRKVQLDAVTDLWKAKGISKDDLPPKAALFLLLGIPKLIMMESELGVSAGHRELLSLVERNIQELEGRKPPRVRGARAATGGGARASKPGRPR